MRREQRSSGRLMGFMLGILLGLSIGVGTHALANGNAESVYRKLEVLAQVLALIENQFVDAVSSEDLVYGAVRGALSVTDEHSAFFSKEEYRELLEAALGEYVGIGIEIDWFDDTLRVTSVLDGSASQKVGLRPGDVILSIDGEAVEKFNLELLHQKMRGPVGSKVVLVVRRCDRDEPWTFTLVRSWVRMMPMEHVKRPDGVLYVKIKTFSRRVAWEFGSLLAREPHPAGIVLDLRGNPGGLFEEAVWLCDLFLKDGLIVEVVGKKGRVLERYLAKEKSKAEESKLAILIDGGSASASEVVAASLADRKRARLFGSQSYGKGSVQSIFDLQDGSGLKLTIARYVTSSGRVIDKQGIMPDKVINDTSISPTADAALQAAVRWLTITRS